ncbi:hypothetical protein [Pedobacter sp. L105]|uniref:hypothetical protein n=1 Tax=Pedobacter sp. L105 TaxID=1641871 RepID=UPI00131E4441|nr:hypothetical protein [Pedobacter sp. L105]
MSAQNTIQISGKLINENQLLVSFSVLPGSDPHELGCFIAIWKGQDFLSAAESQQVIRIGSNQQAGEVVFDDLTLGHDYIIGFGLGLHTNTEAVCASLILPAHAAVTDELLVTLSNITVIPDEIGTDFLIAQLPVLFCRKLSRTDSWIALFNGPFTSGMYDGSNVIAINKVNPHRNSGKIIMNNILGRLERFETYTLVLGMGLNHYGYPDFSRLVSSHTFIVWKSKIYAGHNTSGTRNNLLSMFI